MADLLVTALVMLVFGFVGGWAAGAAHRRLVRRRTRQLEALKQATRDLIAIEEQPPVWYDTLFTEESRRRRYGDAAGLMRVRTDLGRDAPELAVWTEWQRRKAMVLRFNRWQRLFSGGVHS